MAIAGIAIAGYSISQTFTNYSRTTRTAITGPASTPGPTLALNYTIPSPSDAVVILVAGQGAGLLTQSGENLPALVNDTYSECGQGAIASVGIFASTPGKGTYSTTLSSTAYSRTSGSTLGAVAYVLTPKKTTPSRPGAPVNVSATSNNSQASVVWSAPVNNRNVAITSYTATAIPGGQSCRYVVTAPATNNCTIRQLSNGVHYTITVTAANAVGTGPTSAPLEGVTPTTSTPVVDVFDDEFPGGSLSAAWTTAHGSNPNNKELECYSPLNVTLKGGLLNEEAALGKTCGASCPPMSPVACPYVSGGVQWSTLSFTYGTISVRAKMPGGVGTWPAIWLLGTNCQRPSWLTSQCDWPAPGSNEIDVAEILGSIQNRVNQRVHTQYANGTPTTFGCDPIVTNVANNWHTYTLIWAPGSLTWQVDHVSTCQITTLVPSTPMFLIINTAVGGIGVGRVKNSTLPRTTQVDFVRVTQSPTS